MERESASNLTVASNLMVDSPAYPPERYVAGDLFPLLYPDKAKDPVFLERRLTERQRQERLNNLVCLRCGRRCTGLCTAGGG